MKKTTLFLSAFIAVFISTSSFAASNRYQAHWNGKSYLIVDSDNGHLWTFQGDRMLYNGQLDGADFEPPEDPQIWRLKHGKWKRN